MRRICLCWREMMHEEKEEAQTEEETSLAKLSL